MSAEKISYQEKVAAIEARSNQIDRALGFAMEIVDNTSNVIPYYFPKDQLPTDTSVESQLAYLIDLGTQRKNFVEQTRTIALPQLQNLKEEVSSKRLVAESAREIANLIEGGFYAADEEAEIRELLLQVLNGKGGDIPTQLESDTEVPVSKDQKTNLSVLTEADESRPAVEENTPVTETSENFSTEEKKGMAEFLRTPLFPSQLSALNKLVAGAPREEVLFAMGEMKNGTPFHRGTARTSLSKAIFKLRNRIQKGMASDEELSLWQKMADVAPSSEKTTDISKNAINLLNVTMGKQLKEQKKEQKTENTTILTTEEKGPTELLKGEEIPLEEAPSASAKTPDTTTAVPHLFRSKDSQLLAEILTTKASKSKTLDPQQIAGLLYKEGIASGTMTMKDALVKTRERINALIPQGKKKGLKIINIGTNRHPFYYGTYEDPKLPTSIPEHETLVEDTASSEHELATGQTELVTIPEHIEAEEKPDTENVANPYPAAEKITRNDTLVHRIYQILHDDYPSKEGLSWEEITRRIHGEQIEDGTVNFDSALESIRNNGSVFLSRLKKQFGIIVENITPFKGKPKGVGGKYRLEIKGPAVSDESSTPTIDQTDMEQGTEIQGSDDDASINTTAESTPALLTVNTEKVITPPQPSHSLVYRPDKRAVMVDGNMLYFPQGREAGRIMNILRLISANPTNVWHVSDFAEKADEQGVAYALQNLRELKRLLQDADAADALEIIEDNGEALITFKGKIRTRNEKNGRK